MERKQRFRHLGNVVYLETHRRTGSAMDATLARMDVEFGDGAKINNFKCRVEHFIKMTLNHPAFRARYGRRAAMLRYHRHVDTAISAVERWYRDERRTFSIASALGYGNALSLDVLEELRLMLRLVRASNRRVLGCQPTLDLHDHFAGLVSTVLGADDMLVAAE